MGQEKVQNCDIHVRSSGLVAQSRRIQARKVQESLQSVLIPGQPAKALQGQNFRVFRVHPRAIVKGALRDNP